jgi:hypothetical protein
MKEAASLSTQRLSRRGICWSFGMRSIEKRMAAYAAACANLVTQMNELDELRGRAERRS